MLALTRRIGESIEIGDPSDPIGSVTVVEIKGDKVKLGFTFPRNTQVNRFEIAQAKRKSARERA
jgi:carbon storage regulator